MIIKAVFFDCWDTLLDDTVELSGNIELRLAKQLSHARRVDGEVVNAEVRSEGKRFAAAIRAGRTVLTPTKRLKSILDSLPGAKPGEGDDTQLIRRTLANVDAAVHCIPVPPLPGARDILAELSAAGLTICLVSNTGWISSIAVRHVLERYSLMQYFSFCYFSEDGYYPKPNPEMFVCGLRDLAIEPSNAVHVGDQVRSDGVAALTAGLQRVVILEGRSRYREHQQTPFSADPRIIRVDSLNSGARAIADLRF
ncbi:HAD family hydrolase [Streptomyces sp. NBC_00414]|uniref:HAD family hydrolase n=1 Tax=Streptomyces sp. NBC_00414 TaxID=2975739 RepID=UPI002E2377BF